MYGLVSLLVAERAREFAVRLAVGASNGQIRRLVLKVALRWTLLGAAGGLLLTIMAGRLLQASSDEIVSTDPLACLIATAALGIVCALTAWIPAVRAGFTDPTTILREQ